MNLQLSTPVAEMGRIGKITAGRLKKLGIETARDLIFYYPFRWEDLSQILDIDQLQPGQMVTVRGKLDLIKSRRSFAKRKTLTEGLLVDKTGSLKVLWFNQQYLSKVLIPGEEVFLSGKVTTDGYTIQMVNPVYEKVKTDGQTTHTGRLVPIYSLTSNLTQKQIRFLISQALKIVDQVEDFMPDFILEENNLEDLKYSLQQIHFPKDAKSLKLARQRLKFDELFLFQLQVYLSRVENLSSRAEAIEFFEDKTIEFVKSLPFELTDDQRKAAWAILEDLKKPKPMNRLLEGDVGSGKTVVSAIAMLNVALSQKQAAMLAPTEILAAQHYKNITRLFELSGIKIALLTRSQQLIKNKPASKQLILKQIKNGDIDIVIGTHSLIAEKIEFKKLALAVVDEQHRFGVAQRKLLKEKSGDAKTAPHLLSMTATPIPRTLALTLYGDLDLSIIRTMPKDRKKIITKVVDEKNRQEVYDFIAEQVSQGRQVFVICPLIDPSDKLGVKAVTDEYKKLAEEVFPKLKIAILHGKLKSEIKEQTMKDFLEKKFDILVSTSVVEVGVDVPNASVILIEGAQRFGLAQLHQFRGRVGRAQHQSYCFVITENSNLNTNARLQALATAKDGFELAEYDLKFRGPGEIYGVKQSGWLDFKIAKITDVEVIAQAKEAVAKVFKNEAALESYPVLKNKADEFLRQVHLE